MARSGYVYVVLDAERVPVAGFTVKHELVSWLEQQERTERWRVWRCVDGWTRYESKPEPVEMTQELIG